MKRMVKVSKMQKRAAKKNAFPEKRIKRKQQGSNVKKKRILQQRKQQQKLKKLQRQKALKKRLNR